MHPIRVADRVARVLGLGAGLGAMAVLGVRSVLRLETRWDSFWYHIPFAAKRGGLGVAYEMPGFVRNRYDGFPPLADFVQGVLWRATGRVNAVGAANWLALALFLYYCRRVLKAPVGVVAILALTAPLVIIHAATNYIDLFANALLAIGVTSVIASLVFDRWDDRRLLGWGLAGLTGAAWSKALTMPVALACCAVYLAMNARRSRRGLILVALAMAAMSLPYVKNLVVYGNPVWPVRMPVGGDLFPFVEETRDIAVRENPPAFVDEWEPALFVRSVLEVEHPVAYAGRERWTLDQGNAGIAYRSGGLWNVAVVTQVLAAVLLGFLLGARTGWRVLGVVTVLWVGSAWLPESHNLRYYLFLPLTMAGLTGMLMSGIRGGYPAVTVALMAVFLGEFGWMVKENRAHYRIERVDYRAAAEIWKMTGWWGSMAPGEAYCAVGFEPSAFFLTGPTMREFRVVDRGSVGACPVGVKVVVGPAALSRDQ